MGRCDDQFMGRVLGEHVIQEGFLEEELTPAWAESGNRSEPFGEGADRGRHSSLQRQNKPRRGDGLQRGGRRDPATSLRGRGPQSVLHNCSIVPGQRFCVGITWDFVRKVNSRALPQPH